VERAPSTGSTNLVVPDSDPDPDATAPEVLVLDALAHLVGIRPDAPAISDPTGTWTYAQLWEQIGAVAHALDATTADHTGAPVPVVGHLDRHVAAALFGVLCTGRAFVVIDADTPRGRVAEIMARLGADRCVVTRPGDAHLLPATVVPVSPAAPCEPRITAVHASDLAAVVFTSGSTGRPKGVRLDHRVLADMAHHTVGVTTTEPADSPCIDRFSFTSGVNDLCSAAGGQHVHLRNPAAEPLSEFLRWLDTTGFTSIGLVPSLARALVAHRPSGVRLARVQTLKTYGEPLAWSDVVSLRDLVAEGATIISVYGASEATTMAGYPIGPGDPIGTGVVPLGRPRGDRRFTLEPVAGVDGPRELVVRGLMAPGYWDDPDLEATRFGTDPDGTRFWRTGDLAESVDGELLHRGRVDDLVKIAGRLVAPTETERALLAVPGVERAVVLARPFGRTTRLVAHLEVADTTPDAVPDAATVRRDLATTLPAHLVPGVLVRHDRFPVSARGKIDRSRLLHDPITPWRSVTYAEPATADERNVARIVADVLGYGPEFAIGCHDDLWELGLDSLSALELIAALSEHGLGARSPGDLVAYPSVGALAALTVAGRATPSTPDGVGGSASLLWFVPGAGATAVAYRSLARALGPDQSLRFLELPRDPAGYRGSRAVERIAAERAALVAAASPDPAQPVHLGGHSFGGLVAHAAALRLAATGRPVSVVLLDTAVTHRPPGLRTAARLWPSACAAARRPARIVEWIGRALRPPPRQPGAGNADPATTAARMHFDATYRPAQRAATRHRPAAAPSTPTSTGPAVTLLRASPGLEPDRWARRTPDLVVVDVPGDHLSMLQPPHVASVAAAVRAHLGAAGTIRDRSGTRRRAP